MQLTSLCNELPFVLLGSVRGLLLAQKLKEVSDYPREVRGLNEFKNKNLYRFTLSLELSSAGQYEFQ